VSTPALAAAEAVGLAHRVIRHGPVGSLAEAARARGVAPADVVKTLVVRRGSDDFLFVLVPGDRVISWPKLRGLLGVSRLSMPDSEVARQATGYERGTITPLGSVRPWPVIADERVRGREITLGAGEHGLALAADADEILQALDASVADISDPEITIRSVCEGDRPMLAWLVTELWGSEVVAVRGTSLRPAEMAGFIAEQSGRLAGLLTYQLLGGDTLEIVTLNALDRRRGIGTMLIDAAAAKARRSGCREIRLTTTNDNVDALRFYQRRGFRLAELRPGAVDQARRQKPEIPLVGDYGIPLRDEIDLTLPV
jgi:Cys-tRNA(Pro) deacylase